MTDKRKPEFKLTVTSIEYEAGPQVSMAMAEAAEESTLPGQKLQQTVTFFEQ